MARAHHRTLETTRTAPAPDRSAGETAYPGVRADIGFGRLAPGHRLTLDRMKDAYAASVDTLREILNRLTSEGHVVAEGARGFEVMPVSADNPRQVASMRQLLDSALARGWRTAQRTLTTHVQECVEQMVRGGLVRTSAGG